MRLLLFLTAFGITRCCSGIEFNNQPIQFITNSYSGKTFVYIIDRTNTAAAGQKCSPGNCKIDFGQAIEIADRHVSAVYEVPRTDLRSNNLLVGCALHRLDFGEHWCYVIRINPRRNASTGGSKTVDIPVLMDGTIPILK